MVGGSLAFTPNAILLAKKGMPNGHHTQMGITCHLHAQWHKAQDMHMEREGGR